MKFDKTILFYFLLLIQGIKLGRIEDHISDIGIPVPLYGKFKNYPVEQVKYLKDENIKFSICTIKFETKNSLEETPNLILKESKNTDTQSTENNSKKIDRGKDLPPYTAILTCGEIKHVFDCEKGCNFEIKEKYNFFWYHTFDFDVENVLDSRTDYLLVDIENIVTDFYENNCTLYISFNEILKIMSIFLMIIFV